MMSMLASLGLMVAAGAISYWLLAGDPPPERRWMKGPIRERHEKVHPETAVQNLAVTRVFGAIGRAEILGIPPPDRGRKIYQAPHAEQIPKAALKRAETIHSAGTLPPGEPIQDEFGLPPMVSD